MATPQDPAASPGTAAASNMVQPVKPLTFTFGTKQIWTRASFALILVVLLLGHNDTGVLGTISIAIAVLGVVAVGIFVLTFRRFAVTLAPPGITLRGYHTRFIPWHEVKRIDPVQKGSAQRAQIALTDGSNVKCPVPISDRMSADRYFGRKVAAMQQYHQSIASAPPPGVNRAPAWPAQGASAAPGRAVPQPDPSQDYPTGQMPAQP